jgi:alpha/beta superfamily hydrolase
MLLMALCGCMPLSGGKFSYIGWRALLSLGTALLVLLASYGLASTYSRGGWIAYAGSLFLLGLASKRHRLLVIVFFIVFIGLLTIVPQATDRVKSASNTEDLSIANRVLVWEGALAMTADHPLRGVGHHHFGTQFSLWYQPLSMNTRYAAALNNYLTVSSENGLWVFWIYLFVILFLWYLALSVAFSKQCLFMLGMGFSLLAYGFSGLFTYSLNDTAVTTIALLVCIILAILIYIRLPSLDDRQTMILRSLVFAFAIASTATISIFWAGLHLLHQLPTRISNIEVAISGVKRAASITPQHLPIEGLVIYYHDQNSCYEDDARAIVRPLAGKGFIILTIDYSDGASSALSEVKLFNQFATALVEYKDKPVYLLGYGLGGRLAILSACQTPNSRIKAIGSIASEADSPMPFLSLLANIPQLRYPLIVIHGTDDDVVPVESAYRLKKQCSLYGKVCDMILLGGASHCLDDNTPLALDYVAEFFKNHP